jgi:hypothetical protein
MSYPALLGGAEEPLIVVGAHNEHGKVADFSPNSPTGQRMTLYALGSGGKCAGVDTVNPVPCTGPHCGESDRC